MFCEAFTESITTIQQKIEVCLAAQTSTALGEIMAKAEDTHIVSSLQAHYNTPHYNEVFNITRPCHGSQIILLYVCSK